MLSDTSPTSPLRSEFEERVYQEYFIKMAVRPGRIMTKEEMFKREPSGFYEDNHTDAMWYGYQLGKDSYQ